MSARNLSQKTALIIFIILVLFVMAMAAWWIIFMAQLTDEKVDIAHELGADPEYLEQLHQQEISRQIMLGSEGIVFLILILAGVLLIYRTLVHAERLRHQQENFLMAVTHELKTPLTSMEVYLDTLLSDKIPIEKKQAVIPRMKQDLGRLERLVEDILEAGRFEASAYKPDCQRVDLGALVETVADNLQAHNPGAHIRLTRRIEPGIHAQIDGPVIRRAIRAIFDNAVKYSGSSEADLTVSLHRLKRFARLTIADRGIGIEKKELVPIFDRFYRVGHELTRARRGTGLGLYLCRQMIRANGGEIIARSEGIGQGAEFVITLPMDEKP